MKDASESSTSWRQRQLGPLRQRNFRRFFIGYSTSVIGTSMAAIGVSFAVIDNGGTATELGVVLTAGIAATIGCLAIGGVIADRFGRRLVMLVSDCLRFVAQAVFAALVLIGHPHIWSLVVLTAVVGAGTGLFMPALAALPEQLLSADELHDANLLTGLANNLGTIFGPVAAGAIIAATSAGVVMAIDAATYGVSIIALSTLHIDQWNRSTGTSMLRDLREGWVAWRSRSWIWITDIKFALSNAIVLAPLWVLGPVVSMQRLGGAKSWGIVLSSLGSGAVLTGLVLRGRRITRPLTFITLAQVAWALPVVGVALVLPYPVIAIGAFIAGCGSAAFFGVWTTTLQRNVPAEVLARVSSYDYLASFLLAPIGFAIVGPIASVVGTSQVLWFGAIWQIASTIVVLFLPQVRHFTDRNIDTDPGRD